MRHQTPSQDNVTPSATSFLGTLHLTNLAPSICTSLSKAIQDFQKESLLESSILWTEALVLQSVKTYLEGEKFPNGDEQL